ncbi:MAG: hypothetical protein NTW68_15270 [candidate division NC10 bacterium]|nr:hypothetical protein [candidate division NC10 bacterium]
MHEREKLREANYFLERMEASVDTPDAFLYELSAFLSAARSVLQYAYDETGARLDGRQWYEKKVSGNVVLKFFKDKRDVNIHSEPVRLSREIAVSDTAHIGISESIRIEIQRSDGTVEIREHKEAPHPHEPQEEIAETNIRYVFGDWSGHEDVIDLSRQYLTALESFVAEGSRNGIISG